ncbi:MAG TPA: DUF1573 domain-containing protein [Gemmataceae bacterium]
MRTVVLAAIGLLVAAPSSPAQETPTGWAAKLFRTEDGKLPSGYNFGTVAKGAMLHQRFPMHNIYAVPLTVTTSVSCGCVTATPTPQVLQPREPGTLDITMDTNRFTGQKTVTVYVTVSHPQFWSTTTLTIQAFCRGDVELAPAQAVFGAVPVGQPAARDLVVRYHGVQPWQITGIAPGQTAPFEVIYQPTVQRAGLVEYRVRLTLRADAPPGSYKGDLDLTTNDPNYRVVAVPYDVTVQAPLSASPEVARLGAVKVGEARSARIVVRGSQPFRILGVDGQGDGVTAQYRPDALQVHVLTIAVQPTQPGPVQKALTIRTDLGGGVVTAKVEAVAAP